MGAHAESLVEDVFLLGPYNDEIERHSAQLISQAYPNIACFADWIDSRHRIRIYCAKESPVNGKTLFRGYVVT